MSDRAQLDIYRSALRQICEAKLQVGAVSVARDALLCVICRACHVEVKLDQYDRDQIVRQRCDLCWERERQAAKHGVAP